MTKNFITISFLLSGCALFDGTPDSDAPNALELSVSQLETLRNGYNYEGWLIVDGDPISAGKFNIDSSGAMVDPDGIAIEPLVVLNRDVSSASEFVLTIEPFEDPDIGPSDSKLLSGDISDGTTVAKASGLNALRTAFAETSGTFTLATPTASDAPPVSGLWFVEPTGETSLKLPELPPEWIYESWIDFGDDRLVSMGRFNDPEDSDDSDMFSGTTADAPKAPGEDFYKDAPEGLDFPTDLRGKRVLVSVEPEDDDSADFPFQIVPLSADIPFDSETNEIIPLEATFRSPTVTVELVYSR